MGSDAILNAFEETVGPLFLRALANTEEIDSLGATRDLLLPKLMSGEVRVREAEKVLEDVA